MERALGQGGMALVFLARDLRHHRQVAIKVILPEIAGAFGPARFLREIRTAANLNHPNILALFDSGEADGLLYFVMPHVEGESLAQRIRREGQLPLEDALSITRQVASGLHYAHLRGIVHRDIKPGNILLSAGNACIADFGIAQALEETGAEKLTSTGLVVGTPAYMSPEQSGLAGPLDGRSDLYSLGCVLYEMLIGEPPFTGRSAQVILARHSVAEVTRPRAVRSTIPPAIEHALLRALAKSPADRFQTGDELAAALAPDAVVKYRRRFKPAAWLKNRGWIFVAGFLLALAVAASPWFFDGRKSRPLDPQRVAVLPFVGSADGHAIARLMAERFTGEGGPRAESAAQTAASAAELENRRPGMPAESLASAVGRQLGAGLLISGTVTRSGQGIRLSARLIETETGKLIATVGEMVAPADSQAGLLDRVAAALLAQLSGEDAAQVEHLAALPPPVVRAHLAAREAFLRGDWQAAARQYNAVLAADSQFIPAALGLGAISPAERERALALVGRIADRLTPADREMWLALRQQEAAAMTAVAGWESATRAAPERAERWFLLGNVLFRRGPWTGIPDILQRSQAAFGKAMELEPRFVPALGRLIDLASTRGDTALVRALSLGYFAIDSVGDLADYYRWRVAVALDDRRALTRIRSRLDSLSEATLTRMVNVSQLDGLPLDDALRAAEVLWSRSGLWQQQRLGYVKRAELALNRGRPNEAAALIQRWTADHPFRAFDRFGEVVNALFWNADTAPAALAVRQIGSRADSAPLTTDPRGDAHAAAYDVCAANLWNVFRGALVGVPAAVAALRREGRRSSSTYAVLCAAVLDAQLAAVAGRADLRSRVAELDSLVRGPSTNSWILAAANLTAARIWNSLGEPRRALTATRRRAYLTDLNETRVLVAQSTFFREEGRLAAATGDREGAISAFRKYLALRAAPEASLVPQRDSVEAELTALLRNAPVR